MTVTQRMVLVTGIKGRMAAQPRKGCSGSAGSRALLFLVGLTSGFPGHVAREGAPARCCCLHPDLL